jgi:hypothetical protein
MTMRYNAHSSSGDFNGSAAGTVKSGSAVDIGDNARLKVKGLSALVSADCETSTMTLAASWQVSNDGSTWVDVANGPQNAASVVFATGTAGADPVVNKAFPAPDAVYGWRKARLVLTNGVTTGGAADVWTISYCYRTGRD